MPIKNFFPSLLAPTCSSQYPFLYSIHKCHATGTSLNCTSPTNSPILDSATSMLLNCHTQDSHPGHSTSMLLNCNLAQTPHDMPSGLDEGLSHLGYWPDDMPSSYLDPLDPFSYLSHLGHLSYLGLLGHLSYLNILDPEPINLPLHTFIQEEEDT
jgi:hypothetical protein